MCEIAIQKLAGTTVNWLSILFKRSMNKFNLIVAEGHWEDYSNQTVKSLFDLLSDLLKSNGHAYKYVQFADPKGFVSCIDHIYDSDEHQYLYIGSHGDHDGIYGSSSAKPLDVSEIKANLHEFAGLYLGTCQFGTPENLIDFVDDSKLIWCAGYKNSVDWVDSSALDMAFWKIFLRYSLQRGQRTELTIIERTIAELRSKYSSLILDLGFNVAFPHKDEDGEWSIQTAF